MKRIIAFLISATLVFLLFGCTQHPPQETEQLQKPEAPSITKRNAKQTISPAMQAYALAYGHMPFRNLVKDDQAQNITLFNIDGTIYTYDGQSSPLMYVKSTDFQTIDALKQYFSTFLSPEIYAWIDEYVTNGDIVQTDTGLYLTHSAWLEGNHIYFRPRTITVEEQESDTYHFTVSISDDGNNYTKNKLMGVMENETFKITGISDKPIQQTQQQQPAQLPLTEENVFEIVRPALQAYALAYNGFPFAYPVVDDDGYTLYFNADGSVNPNGTYPCYQKSSEFKTIDQVKQYFSTYLAPELYQPIMDQLFEHEGGVYSEFVPRSYTAYYADTVSLIKQEGDIYEIALYVSSDGPQIHRKHLQGMIENDHFKIIKEVPTEDSAPIPNNLWSTESLPEELGKIKSR